MTCKDLPHLLLEASPASPLPSEADDHLKVCTECRNLVEALSLPVVDATPSPRTLRRIERTIATDLRPVRPIAPPFRLVLAFVASFSGCGGIGYFRTRSARTPRHDPFSGRRYSRRSDRRGCPPGVVSERADHTGKPVPDSAPSAPLDHRRLPHDRDRLVVPVRKRDALLEDKLGLHPKGQFDCCSHGSPFLADLQARRNSF
jgi:hypothetical protein